MRRKIYIGDTLSLIFTTPVPISGERVKASDYDIEATIQELPLFFELLSDYSFRFFLSKDLSERLQEGPAPIIISLSQDSLVKSGKNIDFYAVDKSTSRPIDGSEDDEQLSLVVNTGDISFTIDLTHYSTSPYQYWIESGHSGTQQDFEDYLRQPATDAAGAVTSDYNTYKATVDAEIQQRLAAMSNAVSDANAATLAANTAANNANTRAGEASVETGKTKIATKEAINAAQQAVSAKNATTAQTQQAAQATINATLAAEGANTAARNATAATAAANNATSAASIITQSAAEKALAADNAALYANEKGDYANTQGDYAKAQGDAAKTSKESADAAEELRVLAEEGRQAELDAKLDKPTLSENSLSKWDGLQFQNSLLSEVNSILCLGEVTTPTNVSINDVKFLNWVKVINPTKTTKAVQLLTDVAGVNADITRRQIGLHAYLAINALNTKNWTSGQTSAALYAEAGTIQPGSTGIVDFLAAAHFFTANNSSGLTINQLYGLLINGYHSGPVNNIAGICLGQITSPANKSYILIGTQSNPEGDYGIYDVSGFVNLLGRLRLKAGTASQYLLKFDIGALLTTPEAGVFEFDGTDLYFTPVSERKKFVFSDDLSFKETIADVKEIQPAVQFYKRVLADSGLVPDKKTLFDTYLNYLSQLPETVVLLNPHYGLKERTNGGNKYINKLYGLDSLNNDAIQATEGTQPYQSGFIAPNEKRGVRYIVGQTQTGLVDFTDKAFLATDSWSLTIAVKPNKKTSSRIYLNTDTYIDIQALAIKLLTVAGTVFDATFTPIVGLTHIIEFMYSNGTGLVRVNGSPVATTVTSLAVTFSHIALSTTYPFDGEIKHLHLTNTRKSKHQSAFDYAFLRQLYPDIEGVDIGNQHWATSNFEAVQDAAGNVIPEVQINSASAATEKVSNGTFTGSATGWTLQAAWAYGDNNVVGTFAASGANIYQTLLSASTDTKRYIKLTYTVVTNTGDGTLSVAGKSIHANSIIDANKILTSTVGTYSIILLTATTGERNVLGFFLTGGTGGTITLDGISIKECGWADATDIYNARIAAGDTVAQANLAAAMRRYYNDLPANGAIYGKLYNWYVAATIALNPPTGWRAPTYADYTQLQTYLGGNAVVSKKLKKDGITYNRLGTNESGFSAIAGGYITQNGLMAGLGQYSTFWFINEANGATLTLDANNDTAGVSANDNKIYGLSLRLLRNSPVGDTRRLIESGLFTTDITSAAKSIAIPFGYVVKEIRIITSTNVSSIEAKLHNTSGTAVATLITGKACNATSTTFVITADQPTQFTDPTIRVTAAGNGGTGMNITVIIEKIL